LSRIKAIICRLQLVTSQRPAAASRGSSAATQALGESEISRATIESVAESTTDAVIGPLLSFVAGAPVRCIVSANTLTPS
jgi:cobalamin biosynthesis protein CobD/CbiB